MLVARGTGLGEQFATLAAKLAGLEQPVAKRRWFSFRKRPAELRAEVENEAARSVNESVCALLDNPQATANGNAPVAASPLLNRELARTKAELEQLAYAAGHDLREPARLISSYVQLLAERSKSRLDEEANDLIASAMDGVGQLLERLDGLVQYSRVTTRGAEFQPVNCKDVLDRVLASLDEPIAESGAQVTQENLPTVLADPNQVRTVFHHLLANALTFRSVDPPKVRVRAEAGDGEWVFAVEDNGIGIDPQNAQRIFEVFQRLHTRAERPGVGVGLAVTKRIVERHGGRIWVESSPGTGATFYFTLPDCPADLVSQPAGICESHSEPMALAAPPQCIN
jgi:light-regulated signal transduction histidine kinase (bacteriophytochrome)